VHYLNHSETFDPMIITRHLDAIGHTEIVVKQAVPTIEDSFMLYMRKSDKFNIPGNDN
jgi:hypothetical protein